MGIWYYLMLPFTGILKLFYGIFNNYGVAIILFSLAIKIILFPFSIKGKKGMIQMNMLSAQQQKLQKQYGKDQQRYNEELQKLYDKEGVNPMGGCLWTMLPLLILFPVYAVVRRPLKYWLGLTDPVIAAITTAVTGAGATLNPTYPEISIMSLFFKDSSILHAAQTSAPEANLYGLNFNFLGIDLASNPTLKFWEGGISWNSIGLFLIPIVCAATALLSSKIMMKTNEINGQSNQSQQNKMMMWMSPLMMLWFGFIMPGAMGVYIISNSVFSVFQDLLTGKMLKKDYEAAAEARRLREIEEKEEEKRLRREKAEQKAREAEEARKNKAKKKEKAEEPGVTPEMKAASRVGIRQYARGRSYDPNRYGGVTPYHEDGTAQLSQEPDPIPEPEPVPAPVEPQVPEEDLSDKLQAEIQEILEPEEPKEDED